MAPWTVARSTWLCACHHKVPSSLAKVLILYVKFRPGWIEHCVMYAAPSDQGFPCCLTPCLLEKAQQIFMLICTCTCTTNKYSLKTKIERETSGWWYCGQLDYAHWRQEYQISEHEVKALEIAHLQWGCSSYRKVECKKHTSPETHTKISCNWYVQGKKTKISDKMNDINRKNFKEYSQRNHGNKCLWLQCHQPLNTGASLLRAIRSDTA